MANTINRTIILAGPRRVVVHLYLSSDGAAGEIVNYTLLDPTVDLAPLGVAGQDLVLTGFHNELVGFDLIMSYDATTDQPIWVFTPTGSGEQNFNCFGGIQDTSGTGATGKVLLSTNGFTATGDRGAFVFLFTRKGE
jgi:hypothetical protein